MLHFNVDIIVELCHLMLSLEVLVIPRRILILIQHGLQNINLQFFSVVFGLILFWKEFETALEKKQSEKKPN